MGEFLITAASAALLLAAGRLGRRRTDAALALVAVGALVVYTDYFDFHGAGRTFVHHHDAGHYYLGARYFGELGYTDLYVAMLAAEVESEGASRAEVARDLATNRETPVGELLKRAPEVRARFTPERWRDFRRDADYFRGAMGRHYLKFLVDHGFNPTPVWAFLGGALTRLVPPGDGTGVFFLCLLDVFLVAFTLLAVGATFGRRVALLGLIFFTTAYGADFDWVGGAFLRQLWLCALIVGCCCLRRHLHAAAGALLALAVGLRIFPAVFVLGIGVKVVLDLAVRRAPRRWHLRFFGGFAAVLAGLVAATGWGMHGWSSWRLFAANLEVYVGTVAMNHVGFPKAVEPLTAALAAGGTPWLARLPALAAALAALGLVALLAARRNDLGALSLGCVLMYGLLDVAAYYYVFLMVLILVHRKRPRVLASLFGVEAATWGLAVLWDGGGGLYVVQSLIWLLFFGALYFDEVQSAVAGLVWKPREPSHAV